jgi:4-hydroxy-2-oxoheptanedioate aldolase
MRENTLRTIWRAGGAAVNGWLAIPSAFATETMAHAGFDALTIDLQHGIIEYAHAVDMLTAISTTATMPVVRVPWLDPGIIMKALDAGAYGVICPMINTRADAELLVAAARYQPHGIRSYGPTRAALYGGPDYVQHADATVVVFAMIETRAGLDNLDAILSVPGLDAIYIGPSDLSLALGCRPLFDDVDPPVAAAIEYIVARAKDHGVVAGIHNGGAAGAHRRIAMGFQFVTVAADSSLIAAGARTVLGELAKLRAG